MARPKRWTKEELDKLRNLTKTLTFGEIAGRYGLSKSAIQMACNRNGIKGKQRNHRYRKKSSNFFDPFGKPPEHLIEKGKPKPKDFDFGFGGTG